MIPVVAIREEYDIYTVFIFNDNYNTVVEVRRSNTPILAECSKKN